jgi:hypothetical protein
MWRREHFSWVVLVVVLALASATYGQVSNWEYDFTGYNAPVADMETLLGPKIDELDAVATGFSFGGSEGPFRNLNVISQVFRADQVISIGIGENGTNITLQPGDLTFAYTLDYIDSPIGPAQSPVNDFQLFRVVIDDVFSSPPISNPGQQIALNNILAGAYNTAPEFSGPAFEAYPQGFTGEETDYVPTYNFQTSEAEFSYPGTDQVDPGSKAMALLFARDVTIMRIGWDGVSTGEGGNVIGGGSALDDIPVLIPIIPEPTTGLLLLAGAMLLKSKK